MKTQNVLNFKKNPLTLVNQCFPLIGAITLLISVITDNVFQIIDFI